MGTTKKASKLAEEVIADIVVFSEEDANKALKLIGRK